MRHYLFPGLFALLLALPQMGATQNSGWKSLKRAEAHVEAGGYLMKTYQAMESIGCGLVDCEKVDSMKTEALMAEHGREVAVEEMLSAMKKIPSNSGNLLYEDVSLSLPFLETPFVVHSQFMDMYGGQRAIHLAKLEGRVLTEKEKWMLSIQYLPFYSLLED